MSGTSADALDGVLVDLTDERRPSLVAHTSFSLREWQTDIHALAHPGHNEIQRMGQLSRRLAYLSAQVVEELLTAAGIHSAEVAAIGSHGQTIRHEPPGQSSLPFTLQIGDPSSIAELTGITTVGDFRCRDIAAGGQGAPLVPAFHRAVFAADSPRAIVNIGGMANITLLPETGHTTGFDTGPGNCLMDYWTAQHLGIPFDDGGRWATTGQTQPELLTKMLADSYFKLAPPKSTGREYFNHLWLQKHLMAESAVKPEDVQATLLELTARTIVDALVTDGASPERLFVCGGGAENDALMARLGQLSNLEVTSTAELGVNPRWVEAMAFAWLASRTLRGQPGNEPDVTGASHPVILGGIYPGGLT